MDKTIETKFFEAFKWGGVVDKCIGWIMYTYNLPLMKPRASTKEREETPEQIKEKEKWDKYYRETLPKEILEATKAFDDSVIMYMDSPLMDEIEANLNDCQTDAQRERYLFSLLKPFGEGPSGCGYASVYEPIAELNRLKEAIRDCEKARTYWQTLPEDKQLKNVNGEPSGTPKEQIAACNSMCKSYQEQIDWVLHVNQQFIDLTCTDKDKEGSVERCLRAFVGVIDRFANRLDALLLTYGIDLLRLQRESGLYLKEYRLITDVESYIGSMELAQKYIDALIIDEHGMKKVPYEQEHNKGITVETNLPSELNTEQIKGLLQNAMLKGLCDSNYIWLKSKALLAYFADRTSEYLELGKGVYDGKTKTSWKPFETLFGISGLSGAKRDYQKTGTLPDGYKEVDKLFE